MERAVERRWKGSEMHWKGGGKAVAGSAKAVERRWKGSGRQWKGVGKAVKSIGKGGGKAVERQ